MSILLHDPHSAFELRQSPEQDEMKVPREGTQWDCLYRAAAQGSPRGDPIDDYVVEHRADHVLATFKTQREAIEWAKKNGHTAHVARVRHLNDKKKADHWRAA